SETLDMRWPEVDFENRTWTIPAERMKTRQEHCVPLSDLALEILRRQQALHNGSDHVFTGYPINGELKALTKKTMLEVLYDLGLKGKATAHGLRSSFTDWAGDCTDFELEVVEMCLAHQVRSAVRRHYRRSNALEKRRELMQQWADHCGSAVPGK